MAGKARISLEERFWQKVEVTPENLCWEWKAYRNRKGYGVINVKGKVVLAHRMSFILSSGDIPSGLYILHKCDNPGCCNPSHLFVGTLQENNQDMIQKQRACHQIGTARHVSGKQHGRSTKPECTAKGERNGRSKLTEQKVLEIRKLRESGSSLSQISKLFDISISSASSIINKKKWKHVKG